MKKIILLLFLFCLLFACYYIYKVTEDSEIDVVLIGDSIIDNPYLDNTFVINKYFVDRDYRINDIVNIIKYNQELNIDSKDVSIHQLLKKSDIVFISIGMNDLYYKLNDDIKEIYTYLNDMINSYEIIFKEIDRYDNIDVYVLGYYNISNQYNDIFTYINYKLKMKTKEYGYKYLDLGNLLNNKKEFYIKIDNFYLNGNGYSKIYELIVENLKKY